MLDDQKAMLLN